MTDGQCHLCGDTYTKPGMNRHLRSCLPPSEDGTSLLLRIVGTQRDEYWIHTLVEAQTTLATLDAFLRGFWLECCHHLSSFQIDGVDYKNDNPGARGSAPRHGGRSMEESLGRVLDRHRVEEFSYVYDWGSSTHLTLSVVEIGDWNLSTIASNSAEDVSTGYEGVVLLTRNEQPDRECAVCGDPAEQICQECLMGGGPEALYCGECADDHEACGRPRFLPVVNSPRSGVCGYTG